MHIYGDQTWITGNHSVQPVYQIPRYYDRTTGREKTIYTGEPVAINLYNQNLQIKFNSGNFELFLTSLKMLIGSYEKPYLKL
jgi:hypothetical protein